MKTLILCLFFATVLATSHSASIIQLNRPDFEEEDEEALVKAAVEEEHRLRINYHDCLSWRLAVETSNIKYFKTVPENCEEYMQDYFTNSEYYPYSQYRNDSKTVCKEAYFYAKRITLKNDTTNVWVFDLDDTTLSNVPLYAKHRFGAQKIDKTVFDEWVNQGALPALPETVHLYYNLQELGIKPVLISERYESLRDVSLNNLFSVGFPSWEKAIFRPLGSKLNIARFKDDERKKLQQSGYTIIGNIGDQWSDLSGKVRGRRIFKLPNPLYIKN